MENKNRLMNFDFQKKRAEKLNNIFGLIVLIVFRGE